MSRDYKNIPVKIKTRKRYDILKGAKVTHDLFINAILSLWERANEDERAGWITEAYRATVLQETGQA
jgi:hypothetical protein